MSFNLSYNQSNLTNLTNSTLNNTSNSLSSSLNSSYSVNYTANEKNLNSSITHLPINHLTNHTFKLPKNLTKVESIINSFKSTKKSFETTKKSSKSTTKSSKSNSSTRSTKSLPTKFVSRVLSKFNTISQSSTDSPSLSKKLVLSNQTIVNQFRTFNSSDHVNSSNHVNSFTNEMTNSSRINRQETRSNAPITDTKLTNSILFIFFIFWNLFGLIIKIKLLFFTEIKEFADQIYDDCDKQTSYYSYMIRLKYSDTSGGYQLNNGTIMVDLLDPKDHFITRIVIPPDWLAKKYNKRNKNDSNSIKFKLNRTNEYPEIASIKISHDHFVPENCSILIHNFQITDLNNNKLTFIPINRSIKALGPDAPFCEQMYEANKPIQLDAEQDKIIELSPNTVIFEGLLFIFIFLNLSITSIIAINFKFYYTKKFIYQFIICLMPNLFELPILIFFIKYYHHQFKDRCIVRLNTSLCFKLIILIVMLNCSIILSVICYWLITQSIEIFDTNFYISICLINFISLSIIIWYHASHQLIMNRRLKEGSTSLSHIGKVTKEKKSLQVPLDLFVLTKPNQS